jgi:hypothetical protein
VHSTVYLPGMVPAGGAGRECSNCALDLGTAYHECCVPGSCVSVLRSNSGGIKSVSGKSVLAGWLPMCVSARSGETVASEVLGRQPNQLL